MPHADLIFCGLVVVTLLAPAFIARWLASWRPEWQRRRVLAISALPLPVLELAFVGFILVRVWIDASSNRCVADDCPLAGMVAIVMGLTAIVCGLAGLLGAYFATASSHNNDIYK